MTGEQVERAVGALERIAAALEVIVLGAMEPPADAAPDGCPHPPDARVNFGFTDGREDWHCQACGFRTIPQDETHG